MFRNKKIIKILRYANIYGVSRSLNKAFGRLRHKNIRQFYFSNTKPKNVSFIGNGQFAFSTIAYFLAQKKGNIFLDCYDIDGENQKSFAHYYKFQGSASSAQEVLQNQNLEILYIASNHASHTPYAVDAMKQGLKNIYIEKPIAVSYEQFYNLTAWKLKSKANLYAGYNRPYSEAFKILKNKVKHSFTNERNCPFTISYFISGHQIPRDHWYRNPKEGTRICGNVGHWLDATIHILSWRGLPNIINIDISYSNFEEFDDNIVINLTTDKNDLISIILTARIEPFEGINETINFQYDSLIAKIDDFRKMVIWEDEKLNEYKFFPKDVGHKRAVLQPFKDDNRDWREVEISTLLMLHITNMVRDLKRSSIFNILEEMSESDHAVETITKKLDTYAH